MLRTLSQIRTLTGDAFAAIRRGRQSHLVLGRAPGSLARVDGAVGTCGAWDLTATRRAARREMGALDRVR